MPVTNTLNDVIETDALVLGLAPSVAMAAVYTSLAQSMGILFENAVATSNRQNLVADIAALDGIVLGMSETGAAVVEDAEKLDPVAKLKALLKALEGDKSS
ncbi:RebB family R body protein [Roseibium algae]